MLRFRSGLREGGPWPSPGLRGEPLPPDLPYERDLLEERDLLDEPRPLLDLLEERLRLPELDLDVDFDLDLALWLAISPPRPLLVERS